jgi:hypothetical protein
VLSAPSSRRALKRRATSSAGTLDARGNLIPGKPCCSVELERKPKATAHLMLGFYAPSPTLHLMLATSPPSPTLHIHDSISICGIIKGTQYNYDTHKYMNFNSWSDCWNNSNVVTHTCAPCLG